MRESLAICESEFDNGSRFLGLSAFSTEMPANDKVQQHDEKSVSHQT